MTRDKAETPRDAGGAKLCAWCGGPVRQSGIGRSRDYCKQGCREMAYRDRRTQRLIAEAVARATAAPKPARPDSSTDERTPDPVPSVDETAPVLPDPGAGWVRSPDVVDAQLRELDARRRSPQAAAGRVSSAFRQGQFPLLG